MMREQRSCPFPSFRGQEGRPFAYPKGFVCPKTAAPKDQKNDAGAGENSEPAAKKKCAPAVEKDKQGETSQRKRPALAAKMYNIESQARRFRLAIETVNNVGLQRQLRLQMDEWMTTEERRKHEAFLKRKWRKEWSEEMEEKKEKEEKEKERERRERKEREREERREKRRQEEEDDALLGPSGDEEDSD